MAAQPLPVPTDSDLFQDNFRELNLVFRPHDLDVSVTDFETFRQVFRWSRADPDPHLWFIGNNQGYKIWSHIEGSYRFLLKQTPEHRRLRAELIRKWKPWEKSTGPRSQERKKHVSRNAHKGATRPLIRALRGVLRQQQVSLQAHADRG